MKQQYNAKNFTDLENNKRELEEKKKQLLSEINSKRESHSEDCKTNQKEKEVNRIKKQLFKLKEQYSSEINKLKREIEKREKDLLSTKEVLKNSEKTNKELREELEYLIQENCILMNSIKDMEVKLEHKEQLYSKIKDIDMEYVVSLENKIAELESKNEKAIEDAKKAISDYNQIKNSFDFEIVKAENNLKSVKGSLNGQIKTLEKEIKDLRSNANIKKMLHLLDIRMNEFNISEFSLLKRIYEKYENLRKKELEMKRERYLERLEKNKREKLDNLLKNSKLGYLIFDAKDDEWYFYDLDNQIYSVIGSKVPSLVSDIPCRTIVYDDGTAYVIYCYFDIEKVTYSSNDKKALNKKANNSDIGEEYVYFGDFKVLVIGSKNKTRYLVRLAKHGIEAIWHDPFEESENVLKNKVASVDIVIACSKHMSHAALDLIDVNDDKVEIIDRDNEDSISARVRYAAIKLGLI